MFTIIKNNFERPVVSFEIIDSYIMIITNVLSTQMQLYMIPIFTDFIFRYQISSYTTVCDSLKQFSRMYDLRRKNQL